MRRSDVLRSRALAARVTRYHTWPTVKRQTVGEHVARVAQIYVELFGLPRAEVLYYCLHHDSGELLSGDVPFGAKAHSTQLREGCRMVEATGLKYLEVELPDLTIDEQRRVKIADLLEMCEFGHVEWRMGNTYGEPIERDTYAEATRIATFDEREAIARWDKDRA